MFQICIFFKKKHPEYKKTLSGDSVFIIPANKSAVSFEVFKHNLVVVAGFEFIKNMLDFTVSAD